MFSDHQPLPPPPLPTNVLDHPKPKPPVVRGARACTVCRQAKMKCVGGEEGVKPCQRCKRSGAECIFEKHRRGRKPGSKLSEASRVLRHLEKGLSDAKAKVGQPCPPESSSAFQDGPLPQSQRFSAHSDLDLPPLKIPPDHDSLALPHSESAQPSSSSRMLIDSDIDDRKSDGDPMYPANLIRKEGQRTSSFFRTILNPEPPISSLRPKDELKSSPSLPSPAALLASSPSVTAASDIKDPIEAGIILDENQASTLFQLLFLRLNPFINLFDPKLHTVHYVRNRCRFLFSVLIMACCKFFKPEYYLQAQKIANAFATRAFEEGWKSVEVVQAFACMTYWKEPEDERTWRYIGYASRMAVEMGLNTYVRRRSSEESEFQLLERRNRERTYLVLFVHDRSLSVQTGRLWMLPEDDFVRHAATWHSDVPMPVRPEDIIIGAFTQLQRIAADTTEVFTRHKEDPSSHNLDDLLRTCNGRLTQWLDTWHHEIRRAGGDKFHMAFLNIFRLHVRLFLNSFGFQNAMSTTLPIRDLNLQALSACYTSAIEILQIVVEEFAEASMLRHAQESITVMTAYAAVFLLKLLRSPNTMSQLHEGATDEIYTHIGRVAEAYERISTLNSVMTGAAHHARFLKGLLEHDRQRSRQMEMQRRPSHQSSSTAEYYRHYSHSQQQQQSSSSAASNSNRLPPVQVAIGSAYLSPEYASPTSYSPKNSQSQGNGYSTGYPSPSSSQGHTDSRERDGPSSSMRYKDDTFPPTLPPSSSLTNLPPPGSRGNAYEGRSGYGYEYARGGYGGGYHGHAVGSLGH
ncbi:hypothetical protein QCA50_004051 [Cerrena zonata]|uniref:Zn(2)-C6 fungal-type domain-containing protein n=1 Tax=Cerrena zonata TaxID=2478898 RepID=A0AAW0GI23_9APHY